jgi:filamentous hemagglutinin family protein
MNQKQLHWRKSFSVLALGGVFFLSVRSALAQRVPLADNTLGNEKSIVSADEVINDLPSNRIDGGARRGANLFHSFQEFSIDAGRSVYFSNPDGVANILTRITGSSRAEILGTLGVLGNANLFLINPNGIFFGPNAQLDIGGSFLTSTANSLVFDNGFAFSTTDPQTPPLLTVNVPIGLQYGSNPGAIQVEGASLQVPDGQTLTLAGGTIDIDGGQLLAFGGRVELAGVAAPGEIGLTQQGQEWRFGVPEGLTRADVKIVNDANVDVSAGGGGSIAITTRNLTGTGLGTRVRSGIAEGLGTAGDRAGDIDINATESINLDEMVLSNRVLEGGTGNAGDIYITTGTLSLTNGAAVSASTFGRGDAGNIAITATDRVSFDGEDPNRLFSGAFSDVNAGAIGRGGNITIDTGSLFLTNGAGVSASTFGRGDAGNIAITATDAISMDGDTSSGFPSAVDSEVYPGAIGQGGEIHINTGSLSLTNGAVVTTSTFGRGDGGNITITATDAISIDGETSDRVISSGVFSGVDRQAIGQGGKIEIVTGSLSLTNGGVILTLTQGQGDAGNITITASDAVFFDGTASNKVSGFPSGALSSMQLGAIGQGGSIRVNTGLLSIANGAELTVSSEGEGDAGNIEVTADQIRLNKKGSIQAQTASGQGGSISLQVRDLLLLRRRSFISTTAGGDLEGGDGGNIIFNGNFIVAVPKEDSDISANAFTGRGGRVEINAQSLFGIQARPQPTPLSDITASSESGINGIVSINTPDVDPNRGLVKLPVDLTDASRLIAQTCPTGEDTAKQPNEFIVTGRGGLPPTPSEAMNRDAIQVDLVTTNTEGESPVSYPPSLSPESIVREAQGWQIEADGRVILVATASQTSIAPFLNPLVRCR